MAKDSRITIRASEVDAARWKACAAAAGLSLTEWMSGVCNEASIERIEMNQMIPRKLRVKATSRALGGESFDFLDDGDGSVLFRINLMIRSLINASVARICSPDGSLLREVSFNFGAWTAAERLRVLRSVCRAKVNPQLVTNWSELIPGANMVEYRLHQREDGCGSSMDFVVEIDVARQTELERLDRTRPIQVECYLKHAPVTQKLTPVCLKEYASAAFPNGGLMGPVKVLSAHHDGGGGVLMLEPFCRMLLEIGPPIHSHLLPSF